MKCLYCGQHFPGKVDLLSFFLPQKKQSQLCASCKSRFIPQSGPSCPYCCRASAGVCNDCHNWQGIYGQKMLHNTAVYAYDNNLQELILAYKQHGDYMLRLVLQELISMHLKAVKADYFIPIPSSRLHNQQRRFDSISAIYQDLVVLSPVLIKKANHNETQRGKSRKDRMAAQQSFTFNPKFTGRLSGKIVLLDDVYTTGRTLYHARDLLLSRYPKINVNSFTICR